MPQFHSRVVVAVQARPLMASAAQKQKDGEREKPSLNELKVNLKSLGGLLVAGGVITWIFISDGILDITFG